MALKNEALRGSMVAAADVEREWSDVLRTLRGYILALPTRMQQILPQLTNTDVSKIDEEIRTVLVEISRSSDNL